MRTLTLAAAFTALALPALAQGYVAPGSNSGFETTSPEVGVKGAVAADARRDGYGTPQIAPNGSSYVPSNRGVDPASGYRRETTGSVVPLAEPPQIAPNGSAYVPSSR